jgi:hypothetical protein
MSEIQGMHFHLKYNKYPLQPNNNELLVSKGMHSQIYRKKFSNLYGTIYMESTLVKRLSLHFKTMYNIENILWKITLMQ